MRNLSGIIRVTSPKVIRLAAESPSWIPTCRLVWTSGRGVAVTVVLFLGGVTATLVGSCLWPVGVAGAAGCRAGVSSCAGISVPSCWALSTWPCPLWKVTLLAAICLPFTSPASGRPVVPVYGPLVGSWSLPGLRPGSPAHVVIPPPRPAPEPGPSDPLVLPPAASERPSPCSEFPSLDCRPGSYGGTSCFSPSSSYSRPSAIGDRRPAAAVRRVGGGQTPVPLGSCRWLVWPYR